MLAINRVRTRQLQKGASLGDVLYSLRRVADGTVTPASEQGALDADHLNDGVAENRITLQWRNRALRVVEAEPKEALFHADLREVCGRQALLATLHGSAEDGLTRTARATNMLMPP